MQPPPDHSNYYRAPPQPNYTFPTPPGPPEVTFDAISVAWNMITKDLGTWVVATLLCVVVTYAVSIGLSFGTQIVFFGSALIAAPRQPNVSQLIPYYALSIVVGMISNGFVMVLNVGLMNMGLMKLEGRPVVVGDLFSGFNKFLPILGVGLLMALLQMIGFVLLIIPGIYLYGALAFAPLIVLRQNLGPIDAIGLSLRTLSGGKGFVMFFVLFVAGILSGLGALACCVGILFTFPILWLTIAATYYNFFPPAAVNMPPQGVPPMAGPEMPR